MIYVVPPGIGDISWIHSKIYKADKDIHYEIIDGAPRRGGDFCLSLTGVKSVKYTRNYTYPMLVEKMQELPNDARFVPQADGRILVEMNKKLEMGIRLEDCMESYDTEFHYPIETQCPDFPFSDNKIYIAIAQANVRAIKAWSAWNASSWEQFIRNLNNFLRGKGFDVEFLIMGAKYDLQNACELEFMNSPEAMGESDVVMHNLCGKYKINESLGIITKCKLFIGFASGLGIASNVLGVPTLMLYPQHLMSLMNAWEAPDVESMGVLWDEPESVYRSTAMYALRCING